MQIQESHASSLALQAHQGTAQRGAPGWECSGSTGAGTRGAQQSRAEPGATAHCSLAAIPQLQIPTSTPTRPRSARTVRAAAAWLMRHDRTQLVHGSFAGWGRIRACCKLPTQGLRQPAQTVRNQRPGRGLGEAAPANGAGGGAARHGTLLGAGRHAPVQGAHFPLSAANVWAVSHG